MNIILEERVPPQVNDVADLGSIFDHEVYTLLHTSSILDHEVEISQFRESVIAHADTLYNHNDPALPIKFEVDIDKFNKPPVKELTFIKVCARFPRERLETLLSKEYQLEPHSHPISTLAKIKTIFSDTQFPQEIIRHSDRTLANYLQYHFHMKGVFELKSNGYGYICDKDDLLFILGVLKF